MLLAQTLDAMVNEAILDCVILPSHVQHNATSSYMYICHRRARPIGKRSHRKMSPPVSEPGCLCCRGIPLFLPKNCVDENYVNHVWLYSI